MLPISDILLFEHPDELEKLEMAKRKCATSHHNRRAAARQRMGTLGDLLSSVI